jgi:large subunit ribosomal protein L10
MAKKENHAKKQEVIDEIAAKAKKAKSIIFINYRGLTVEQTTALRVAMRKEGVDYKVYKNRLVKRALDSLKLEADEALLVDTLAVAFSYEDELAGARILNQFKQKTKKIDFKFGFLGKTILDEKATTELASIPSKEVLLGKLLFCLQSPMQKLAIGLSKVAEKKAAE